ncbi:MAG: helix-hairpin-helix domain-containing protein [Burkholderiaceae bacterium]|nr:helix-hairpin-helix domain-containing protein [Burkholderiaceae bacterium]
MLATPGLGPGIVARLEQLGIHSLATLQGAALDQAIEALCHQVGNAAPRNRRRALQRAVAVAVPQPG